MKKNHDHYGYFAYWTLMGFLNDDLEQRRTRKLLKQKHDCAVNRTIYYFAIQSCISSIRAQEQKKRNRSRPVRLKECATWTSTVCLQRLKLQASQLWQDIRSYRMHITCINHQGCKIIYCQVFAPIIIRTTSGTFSIGLQLLHTSWTMKFGNCRALPAMKQGCLQGETWNHNIL